MIVFFLLCRILNFRVSSSSPCSSLAAGVETKWRHDLLLEKTTGKWQHCVKPPLRAVNVGLN